jgi:hypothetical protein
MNKKVIFCGYIVVYGMGFLFAQSQPLTEEESEQLSHSAAAIPISHIDVVLQRTEIQFGSKAVATKGMIQKGFDQLKKRYSVNELTVKTMGTFLPTGEYETITQERIRLFGIGKFRDDIQYYDSLTGKIKEDRTNIAHLTMNQKDKKDNTYFVIDHLMNRMEISDVSTFSLHFNVLTYGTPNYSVDMTMDILKGVKNKSVKKQKELYVHKNDSQCASKVIECLDAKQRKLYEIQVDPNDVGICHELSIFDVDSGKLKKKVEYSDFMTGKDFVRPYPRKIVTTDFTDGNITEQETVEIKKVSFMKNTLDVFDPQKAIEGEKIEINDHRAKKLHDANESESQH